MKLVNAMILLILSQFVFCQSSVKNDERMQWFIDAKFGIFIHYGIYAVKGVGESWSFRNYEISHKDYMSQLSGFTAKNYNPVAWAKLFKESGAKYAVLTSKHHDGVALWNTQQNDLSVVNHSPAARDLITPYAKALRDEGLKVGIYFSHLDWTHPDYATVFHGDSIIKPKKYNTYEFPKSGIEDTVRWNRFLKFRNAQIFEIQKLINPDLWWFDGEWTRTAEQWKTQDLRKEMLKWNPNTIMNGRMIGCGDYATPEQGIPILGHSGPWELCMTLGNHWGYRPNDTINKSLNYILRVFTDCISLGGNLLLNIGPKEDGTIPEAQVEILKGIGRWINKHAEAIYGTTRGLPFGHFYGPTTLSKDRKTVYCFVLDAPKDALVVKGIRNKITKIRLLGSTEILSYKRNGGAGWLKIPGVLLIDLSAEKTDKNISVIAIDLDSPLDLYHGNGENPM